MSVDVSSAVKHITQDKNGTMACVRMSVKYLQHILHVKKISLVVLVNVPASVIKIVRLVNTCKTLNV